jgi:hypothetical protein
MPTISFDDYLKLIQKNLPKGSEPGIKKFALALFRTHSD